MAPLVENYFVTTSCGNLWEAILRNVGGSETWRPPTHPRSLISPEQCGTEWGSGGRAGKAQWAKWYGIAAISNIQINDTVLLRPDFKYSSNWPCSPFSSRCLIIIRFASEPIGLNQIHFHLQLDRNFVAASQLRAGIWYFRRPFWKSAVMMLQPQKLCHGNGDDDGCPVG